MSWGTGSSSNSGSKFGGGWGFNNSTSPGAAESIQPTKPETDLGQLAIPETLNSAPVPPEDLDAKEEPKRLEEEGLSPGISDEDRDMLLHGKRPGERRIEADQDIQQSPSDLGLEDKRVIKELDEEGAAEAEAIVDLAREVAAR